MRILFVHPNFPGQFGQVARYGAERLRWQPTFVTRASAGSAGAIERIQYHSGGGATLETHFCSRSFENAVWNCDGIYKALKLRPDIEPDLIVGHSGFGSTLFLRDLYPRVPVVNLFEWYHDPDSLDSEMQFRHDIGEAPDDAARHRARCRNAMLLLDLENCDAAYTPTAFQHSRFPRAYQPKIEVAFSGIDRSIYHSDDQRLRAPVPSGMRRVAGATLPVDTRIVTYASHSFEPMRGFDIFMRAARRIVRQFPEVLFFVVGSDRAPAGENANGDPKLTFKQWVMDQEEFDLTRFFFPGPLAPADMAELLGATDLHIYLTAPFVLSTSMLDAMSCGAVVLGSATAPVQEVIVDGENGLLIDFFDVEGLADRAVQILSDPSTFRHIARAAEQTIVDHYSLEVTLPRLVAFYENAAASADRIEMQ